MRIGLFTDTYFPQVSGVATSIKTLKEELEKLGHEVYIFTTTDKNLKKSEDKTIVRLPSVPFVSFSDRRVVYRGLLAAYKVAKKHRLDIIHTQTEFGMGLWGKLIGRALRIPVIHTYHTQYEDYVHYIAKGRVITPSMVKYIIRGYLSDLDGVICPSSIVLNVLDGYSVKIPKRIIPTGIRLEKFVRPEISDDDCQKLRSDLGIKADETMLLSLSRISYEKNIQAILQSFSDVLVENSKIKLVVAGDGPYLADLKDLALRQGISSKVIFTGMIAPEDTVLYYKAADFFISASTSETQGLTYTESLASGTPIIAQSNAYLDDLIDDKAFGYLYQDQTDLVAAILQAVANRVAPNEAQWQKKLTTLSAETFGKAVYAFYLDAIISKSSRKPEGFAFTVEGSLEERSINLVKKTVRLPKRVVKGTAKRSVKVVKAPLKLVKSIQDFLD